MKKQTKIQKKAELVNNLATFFDSDMESGEKMRMTRLAESIQMSNGSHPHVSTVRTKCTEFAVIKEIINRLKFHFDKKNGKLVEIEKLEQKSDNIEEFKKLLLPIEEKINELINLIKK